MEKSVKKELRDYAMKVEFIIGKKYVFSRAMYEASELPNVTVDKYIDYLNGKQVFVNNQYVGSIKFRDYTVKGAYKPMVDVRVLPEWCVEINDEEGNE